MRQAIKNILIEIFKELDVTDIVPEVEISDNPVHGEYTTNVAMRLTKILKKPPMEIAEIIREKMMESTMQSIPGIGAALIPGIDKIEVVAPGFINFFITESQLINNLRSDHNGIPLPTHVGIGMTEKKSGMTPLRPSGFEGHSKKTIMVEFAHPNTHKAFHIGHLRNITTGECIVRLLEANGNRIIRANYQGDVGLHIAKALYGILQITDYKKQMADKKTIQDKVTFLANAYVAGNKAYEEDGEAKQKINAINKQIYAKDPTIYDLYKETRQWSLDYFDTIYKRVGSHFDRFYFESESFDIGKKLVTEYVEKGVFEKSDGAIIFPGKKYGLHNRVFITSEGNPTYEGKDVGLAKLQFNEYHPDQIIHCVASEQTEYFKVIFEAISQVFPETKGKEYHLIYGWVRLKEGKMSSRSGNVVLGEWLLDETKKEMASILNTGDRGYTKQQKEDIAEKTSLAAVKYAFLKVSTTQEIAFDIKESVNINGDSGPYLLYAYARCRSVIQKREMRGQNTEKSEEILHSVQDNINEARDDIKPDQKIPDNPSGFRDDTLFAQEEKRNLMRLLFFFPEIVENAGEKCAPNILCSYLFDLSQTFNLFYAKYPILGNEFRLSLTQKTAETLKQGLYLLGIETIERM